MKQAQIIDLKIRAIAQKERDALGELVIELRELDSIRGYEPLGYDSLFDYLTRGVGYSAGAAQRRIDAARLSKDVPDLGERLQSGTLDLHHITAVSKAVRLASKCRNISVSEKCAIIEKLKGQTEAKTQLAVAEFFDLPVITETKRSVQKDESVRFEITLSREQAALIEQAQALVSHAVPSKNLAEFLEYVSRKIIQQKARPARERNQTVKPTATVAAEAAVKETMRVDNVANTTEAIAAPATAIMAADSHKPRVPESLHRKVRSDHPVCAQCGSAWFPQTDHKRARWVGGTNARDNLQTLCGPCNRAKYRREIRGLRQRS